MTTVLQPSAGAPILFTQLGIGATPGFSALDDRRASTGGLQEGVNGSTDFMVVQRAAGANMSVDIGMPAGGYALVQGDTISGQGLYTVPVHSTTINEVIAAAHPTSPRVDSVILEIQDTAHDGSGGNLARTRVLTGTATAGTNLNTRAGAASPVGNALLLADVLVGAAAPTIPNTVIRDRRTFARGAYVRIARTSADYTSAATSATAIDATNLQPRIECAGVPVRVTLRGEWSHTSATSQATFALQLDGVNQGNLETNEPIGGGKVLLSHQWELVPAAGSHLFLPTMSSGGATLTAYANATVPLTFTVEEIVRQNTANNSQTSG